jgi:hypothetical protein
MHMKTGFHSNEAQRCPACGDEVNKWIAIGEIKFTFAFDQLIALELLIAWTSA